MSKFLDAIAKAAKSDAGQSVVGGATAAYDSWVDDGSDNGGSGGTSLAITDQVWFWPAVIVGGVVVLVLITKK